MGKAITYGLLRRDMRVVVTDGVPQQAIALAKHFDCRSVEWAGRHTVPADLIVNCTPLGMHPNVDETPYDKHYLRAPMIVFDVVYNPENTLLVKDARSRNCTVITGVDMFVRQACLQFQHFTGMAGPAELMARRSARLSGPPGTTNRSGTRDPRIEPRLVGDCHPERSHPERGEGSRIVSEEILRSAQND